MASYGAWNKAIAAYFTTGIPKGSPVFLSLDDEAIEEIAADFLEEPVACTPLEDFTRSVIAYCLNSRRTAVDLTQVLKPSAHPPRCVGFLGLLVLAAYRMRDGESIDDSNYFRRLTQALSLHGYASRPDGLPPGAEVPLWKVWNHYLTAIGFQATAEPGMGAQKFIHYALSQAILRDTDADYLRQIFQQNGLPSRMSTDQLGFWLSRQPNLRAHLREGLNHASPARVWEFCQAGHRVYESCGWSQAKPGERPTQNGRSRQIECGIYRIVNFLGQATYWLFPKEPAHRRVSVLQTRRAPGAPEQPLILERPGFFTPIWETRPFVTDAEEFEIVGDPIIHQMIFPAKDFWVLQQDPEDPGGAWATWKPYLEIGDSLLVLTQPGPLDEEMHRFKEAKLVDWAERIQVGDWIEFHGCMVLSYEWGGFISKPDCKALADFLAPRAVAGISLSGGLRDKNQNAWLEGCPPTVKVYGFDRRFQLRLSSSAAEFPAAEVQAQQEYTLPNDLEVGTYQLLATWSGTNLATRMFNIIPWRDLQEHPATQPIINRSPHATAGIPIRGALLANADEVVMGGLHG